MLDDGDIMAGFLISLEVAAATLILSVPIGALGAIHVSRLAGRARARAEAIFLSPLSVPMVLTAFGMLVFFTRLDLVNSAGLVIGHTVVSVPYVLRTTLGSLALTDPALPRAAAIFGASPLQVIVRVVLPTLRPGLLAGGLFAALSSFNNIIISAFMAAPGSMPLPVAIFTRMNNLAEPSMAAASVTTLAITSLLCLILEWRFSLFRSLAGR
jgi:putative spermidine/putrescine transport system permease protein